MMKDKDFFIVVLQIDADDLCVHVKNLWVVNVVIILMDIRVNDVILDQWDDQLFSSFPVTWMFVFMML